MPLSRAWYRTVRAATLALILVLPAPAAFAGGEVGEHVGDLQAHLGDYEKEVRWLIAQVDEIVDGYEKGGVGAARAERVVDIWESVDFHAAIEVNYIPIYASIWQGLFAVRGAVEREAPLVEVRAEQAKLEAVFWQALGAVKMAAQVQQRGAATAAPASAPESPDATLAIVGQRLDRVVAKHAEKLPEEAKAIVFDTYLSQFEGVEGALIERDAALVESLEIDFNVTLPKAIDTGASVDEVRAIVQTMQGKLARARELLAAGAKKKKPVF